MGDVGVITSGFVNVNITGSFPLGAMERRLPKDITISQLKGKLEIYTGASSSTMVVKAYNKEDKLICVLDDNHALLGSYHIDDGCRLHIEDSFVLRKQLEDENAPDVKFELTEEEYSRRSDTLQAFLKQNRMGKYNAEEMAKKQEVKTLEELRESNLAQSMKPGQRCQITIPGHPIRRAEIKFVGETKFKPGIWVGVRYDEPLGKNDGSCDGVRYFECPLKYGGFVRPSCVEVGDFPEEEMDLDEL